MNKNRLFFFIFALLLFSAASNAQLPKLAVVIVLDQVGYEDLNRYSPYFGDGGFRYLFDHGANYVNANYAYTYTKTSCGHAAIMTGTYDDVNGIIGNHWYERATRKVVSSVEDSTETLVGAKGQGASPRRLLVNPVGDMLRDSRGSRHKVLGISNKDRSAILMAGHSGTAYWFQDTLASTSTYYMQTFPRWVQEFNRSGIFSSYVGKQWNELRPDIADLICDVDTAGYEVSVCGGKRSFPYSIPCDSATSISHSLSSSPFTSEILLSFARQAVIAESLGARGATDILCVGISTADVIGHGFGPNSHEYFDNMLRTDRYLAEFFRFLDERVGLEHCLIVLSSDHGIVPIPEYLKKTDPAVDAGRVHPDSVMAWISRSLVSAFGTNGASLVEKIIETNVYLNREEILREGLNADDVMRAVRDSLLSFPMIMAAYTRTELEEQSGLDSMGRRAALSFYPPRGADVVFIMKPYYIVRGGSTGTTHLSPFEYDTHVPLILAGSGIRPGTHTRAVEPVDIAATLMKVLGLVPERRMRGRVLEEAVR